MTDQAPKDPHEPAKALKLQTFPRFVLITMGVGGLAGGSVAVFTQDVEAGPVAMIAIGALLFVMGLAGYMPTRLKIGDNEAEWQAVADFVERTVEDAAPEEKLELFTRLNELNKALPEAAAPALSAMLYEQTVLEMIREIANELRPQIRTESRIGPGAGVDMLVVGPSGARVAVEVTQERRLVANFAHIHQRYTTAKESLGLDHLMIITAGPPSNRVKAYVSNLNDVSIVSVAGAEDMPLLRRAVIRQTGASE